MKEATLGYTDRDRASLAMTVALVSFAMLFASLFLTYAVYRVRSAMWPPMGFDKIPLTLPSISSAFILLSSFSFIRFQRRYEKKATNKTYYYLTLILALGFLFTQNQLWNYLNETGVFVESGTFASILHSFTWIHAGHVVLGMLALIFCLPALRKNKKDYSIRISNVGKFWHFLGIIWIFMYIGIFLF